jgi:hypothetical protein
MIRIVGLFISVIYLTACVVACSNDSKGNNGSGAGSGGAISGAGASASGTGGTAAAGESGTGAGGTATATGGAGASGAGVSGAGASGAGGTTMTGGSGAGVGGTATVTGGASGTAAGTGGAGGSAGTSAGESPLIGGCAIYPADNAWNTRIDDTTAFPTDPNSAAILQNISDHATRDSEHYLHADFGSDFGIPYTVVEASQATVPITINDAPDESDLGPYPIPSNAAVEGGSDAHVLVLQSGACMLYELYGAQYSGGGWSCSSAAKFDLSTNAIRTISGVSCPTSADAAGLPIFPGLVKYEEVATGRITHAVRFTVQESRKAFIRPGTHYASSNTDSSYPPMGMRVRLKVVPAGITGQALVVATALKEYGMILADNGSNWFISGAPDSNFDDEDLNQLKTIPETDFEVVTMGRVYTSEDCP